MTPPPNLNPTLVDPIYELVNLVCDGFVSKNVHKKGRYFNVKIPLKYFAY